MTASLPAAARASADEARSDVRAFVDLGLRGGVYDEETLVSAIETILEDVASEAFEGDTLEGEVDAAIEALGEELTALGKALAEEGLRARAVVEATWTTRTTNDALDDAFLALDARGIAAFQALGQDHDPWGVVFDRAPEGARGVVFYNRDDLARALDGEPLRLSFSSLEPNAPPAVEARIVREILHVLAHYGLEAAIEDDEVCIPAFEWKKRVSTRAPPGPPPPGEAPRTPLPPPPPAKCATCGGKGWIVPSDPSQFPTMCLCKRTLANRP